MYLNSFYKDNVIFILLFSTLCYLFLYGNFFLLNAHKIVWNFSKWLLLMSESFPSYALINSLFYIWEDGIWQKSLLISSYLYFTLKSMPSINCQWWSRVPMALQSSYKVLLLSYVRALISTYFTSIVLRKYLLQFSNDSLLFSIFPIFCWHQSSNKTGPGLAMI